MSPHNFGILQIIPSIPSVPLFPPCSKIFQIFSNFRGSRNRSVALLSRVAGFWTMGALVVKGLIIPHFIVFPNVLSLNSFGNS